MLRREFVRLLAKVTGGTMVVTLAPPLLQINTSLLSEAQAQCKNQPGLNCQQDCCTIQDNCGATDTTGHTCTTKDLCDTDASGDCTDDQCTSDISGTCTGDRCIADSSGDCINDGGPACAQDTCPNDGSCAGDIGGCRNDWSGTCVADSSGPCHNDGCAVDKSGACTHDVCTSDKSGDCQTDFCVSDSSKGCTNDECRSDSSGTCISDSCRSDTSGACETDVCVADSSGACWIDHSVSDTSGACKNDWCQEDASGACRNDWCESDKSSANWDPVGCPDDATPRFDRCNSDYSGTCTERDVCVLDFSASCTVDLCREDRSTTPFQVDTCSLDLALNLKKGRRDFAKAGLNQAIKWLYHLSTILLFISLAQTPSLAATVVDAHNAVFSTPPTYATGQAVTVQNPAGPFLRDCDGDGVLEADTNGDGLCNGDPKIIVMDNTGGVTKGLPFGTAFSGSFQFTCFYLPSDVALIATGPLTIKASREVAVFGAVRLPNGAAIATPAKIDLRTSAWLSDLDITFITAQAGEVDSTQTTYAQEDSVPPIQYNSICGPRTLWLPLILRAP